MLTAGEMRPDTLESLLPLYERMFRATAACLVAGGWPPCLAERQAAQLVMAYHQTGPSRN